MVLQCIPDQDDPWAIVRRLLGAVADGSYLTVSDAQASAWLAAGSA
jgi:hypothetical protein